MPAELGCKNRLSVIVVVIREQVAATVKHESGILRLFDDRRRFDAVKRIRVAAAAAGLCRMIDHDERSAGF